MRNELNAVEAKGMDDTRSFKILIVDYNVYFRETLKSIIWDSFPRARIFEAENPDTALALALTEQPLLIMLEIDLKGASGLDLTHEIRSYPTLSAIAVVTQDDLPEYEIAAYNRGADYFISKYSHNAQTVIQVIRDSLRSHARKSYA
jgi:two-component system, NarL family, nitrate/nitrite response regulator NarP